MMDGGSDVRWTLTEPLREAFMAGDDILLVSHSLGTLVSYDVLWKFAHYGEYRDLREKGTRVKLWITLGCPLGDETVKRNLKGALADGYRRYPDNIARWLNIAAEDDYISHDQGVKNDFYRMEQWNMIKKITDKRIYNFAVREDGSNPHHSSGYLIHPEMSRAVAGWLGFHELS